MVSPRRGASDPDIATTTPNSGTTATVDSPPPPPITAVDFPSSCLMFLAAVHFGHILQYWLFLDVLSDMVQANATVVTSAINAANRKNLIGVVHEEYLRTAQQQTHASFGINTLLILSVTLLHVRNVWKEIHAVVMVRNNNNNHSGGGYRGTSISAILAQLRWMPVVAACCWFIMVIIGLRKVDVIEHFDTTSDAQWQLTAHMYMQLAFEAISVSLVWWRFLVRSWNA